MDAYFSESTLRFLRGLTKRNDRDWFNQRKTIYERDLKEPMLALIQDLNEAMLEFSPEHVRPPQKILLRIYRDTRFSKDKRPYKTHLSAWWGREGALKTSGAGFYLSLSGAEITIAAGVFMPDREQLLAIRRYLVDHHAELQALLTAKRLRALLTPVEGQPLSRPPKGFVDASVPAQAFLRCRQWGASTTLAAEVALLPVLRADILKRFRVATPLVQLLNEPLLLKQRRSMF